MFYTYRQNNSGGYYIGPSYVIVEADSSSEADFIAEQNGIYFNGVMRETVNVAGIVGTMHGTMTQPMNRWFIENQQLKVKIASSFIKIKTNIH